MAKGVVGGESKAKKREHTHVMVVFVMMWLIHME